MSENEHQPLPERYSKFNIVLLLVLGTIVILELIFTIFSIPAGGRQPGSFDMQAGLAVFILACFRPKLFTAGWRTEVWQMPTAYKIYAGITVYILIIKLAYFLGYLAAVFFKHR